MATSDPQHSDLLQALRGFASSPRYNFLKSLQVGPILGDDAASLGAVAQMTFEELVSSIEIGSADLANLQSSQERLLITILGALADGESEADRAQGFAAFDEASESQDDEDTQPAFNSVQCELELREKLGQVRNHPQLDRLKESQLGKFWASDLPRAPFEESLTIGQLLSLDLGMLAKKRSMTSMRMYALARALENALGTVLEPGSEDVQPTAKPTDQLPVQQSHMRQSIVQAPVQASPKVFPHKWFTELKQCSVAERAMIELVVDYCFNRSIDHGAPIRALKQISQKVSAHDFLRLVKGEPITPKLQKIVTDIANSKELRLQVSAMIAMLRAPGTHISNLAELIELGSVSPALSQVLASILVRGLGAECVTIDGKRCQDVWTLNPQLAQLIFADAQSEQALQSRHNLLDHLDPVLHTFLTGLLPAPGKGKKRHRGR